jgi:acetyl-CoA carboxylase biotin carboxyl carrier protein
VDFDDRNHRKDPGEAVTQSPINFQDLLQLMELVKSSSQFAEIRLRSGDMELELRRGSDVARAMPDMPAPGAALDPATARNSAPTPPPPMAAPALLPPPAPPAVSAERATSRPAGAVVVKAPMVGTVYQAPEPGAAPFVRVGQRVDPGTTVCIIEVMKLMNSISAECNGMVSEILFKDGQAVEFGQELFVISPQ